MYRYLHCREMNFGADFLRSKEGTRKYTRHTRKWRVLRRWKSVRTHRCARTTLVTYFLDVEKAKNQLGKFIGGRECGILPVNTNCRASTVCTKHRQQKLHQLLLLLPAQSCLPSVMLWRWNYGLVHVNVCVCMVWMYCMHYCCMSSTEQQYWRSRPESWRRFFSGTFTVIAQCGHSYSILPR